MAPKHGSEREGWKICSFYFNAKTWIFAPECDIWGGFCVDIMGREQELLEAARSGNVSVIEKLISPRKKLTVGSLPLAIGPFPSLRRAPNPNCHDQNGDTPLHLAALNGHVDVVKILLKHDATANITDNKGCTPLHLGAWSGNAEMCAILLTHGPSIAKVNEQNLTGETPLHCAAQYGHTDVVSVLLPHLADPLIRNNKSESPLELAAQYGRLETVELLLRKQPGLLASDDLENRSPLHLSSRNGHKQVVRVLLDSGFNINKLTENGTALHEAAIFGKQDVVRLLLKRGVSVNLTDSEGRNPLEVLSEHKSQLSLDTGRIILDYLEGRSISDKRSSSQSTSSDLLEEPTYDYPPSCRPLSQSEALIGGERRPASGRSSGDSSVFGAAGGSNRHSTTSEGYFIYDTPRSRPIPFSVEEVDASADTFSVHSAPAGTSLSPQSHSEIICGRSPPQYTLPVTPDTPKKPPRRKLPSSTPSRISSRPSSPPRMVFITKRASIASNRDSFSEPDRSDPNLTLTESTSAQSTMKVTDNGITVVDNNNSCDSANSTHIESGGVSHNLNSDLANSNLQRLTNASDNTSQRLQDSTENNNDILRNRDSSENRNSSSAVGNGEYLRHSLGGSSGCRSSVESATTKAQEYESTHPAADSKSSSTATMGKPHSKREVQTKRESLKAEAMDVLSSAPNSRPPSLDFSSKRSSAEVAPLSPTGYKQPPTPDHPPPSPMTAVLGIQEKINPMDKRRSRDMETITELEFLSAAAQPVDSSTGTDTGSFLTDSPGASAAGVTHSAGDQVEGHSPDGSSSILRKKHRGISSGKTSGSVETGSGVDILTNGNDPFQGLTKGAIPKGQRRVKSQIFDNLPHIPRSKKRISAPGLYLAFDPLMEGEEEGGEVKVRERSSVRDRSGVRASALVRRSLIQQASGSTEGGSGDTSLDETEEWAQIADILSSCGGRMSASEYCDYTDFEKRLQKIFAEEKVRGPIQCIGDWLDALGLPQYENFLIANGFDDMDFMGPNILEDSDLMEIGITDESHRKKILEATSKLPLLKPIVEDTCPASVDDWLESLRLSHYLDTFHANQFTSMDRVRNIWELELNSVLDISPLGHRKRILASLRVPPEADTVSQGEFIDFTKDWKDNLAEQNEELQNLNLFKDYTNVRPRGKTRRKSDQTEDQEQEGDGCELCQQQQNGGQLLEGEGSVQIRPPNPSTVESSTIKQWRHQPEVLIKGCCNYTVQYLGSTLVKSLQGTESTRESIHKMKKSTDSMAKVPSVILSISYRGVKFIDAKSKHVICEHDISNIFCACQDGENLNYFAYITRDHITENHYCHVFCVRSTELATEIILTLGEAFEVAYQVAIRERIIEEENEPEEGATSDDYDNVPPQEVAQEKQDPGPENGNQGATAATTTSTGS